MDMLEVYLPCCGKKVFVAPNDKMELTCNECSRRWKIKVHEEANTKRLDFSIVEVTAPKNKQVLLD